MKMIVCVDNDWNIGYNGKLLANIPEDLAHFKNYTLGKTVVMGRKTYDSLPFKNGLPDRENVVLSRDKNLGIDLDTFLSEYQDRENLVVIGGAEIYEMLLPHINEVKVTQIQAVFTADTKISNLNNNINFTKIDSEVLENSSQFITYIHTYKRQ